MKNESEYKAVLSEQKAEIQELEAEIAELKAETEDMRGILQNKKAIIQKLTVEYSKRNWKNEKKGLLIIIGNLKHYLGDTWRTIFPNGSENVDAFLEKIDTKRILSQDTWNWYEKAGTDATSGDGDF